MTAIFTVFLNGLLLTIAFAVTVTFVCVVWIFLHLALYEMHSAGDGEDSRDIEKIEQSVS